MSALQIWLQNHNRKLTQDAIDEALMEYINMIERELESNARQLAQQKETIERKSKACAEFVTTITKRGYRLEQANKLIEQLADCAKYYSNQNMTGWPDKAIESLAAYAKYKEK